MYIYKSGAIGEAVHAKIESAKQSVRGKGKAESVSFGDLLKSYMTKTEPVKKPVTAVTGSENARTADGSALIYAMRNSADDTTAAAVLNSLGYNLGGSSANTVLRTAAEDLTASAKKLREISASGDAASTAATFAEFAADYNELLTRLASSASTSGYLYRSSLSAYTGESTLNGTGFSAGENGLLTVSGEEPDADKLSAFLTGVSAVAQNVSKYAGTVSEADSLDLGTSSYYSSIMSLLQ